MRRSGSKKKNDPLSLQYSTHPLRFLPSFFPIVSLVFSFFFQYNQKKYLILKKIEKLQREDANLYLMLLILKNKYKEAIKNLPLLLHF